ncbi:MAG: DUF86 domain-containing protein [Lachnospiraceae bacterium]|nr:DUF86 domain-containing protein [Lachnospiraceae bacterium]
MLTERDAEVLRHIVKYCLEINHTIEVFGKDENVFRENSIYQNATALCVLQIGELTIHLTDDFKRIYSKMPWSQIKELRNIVAYNYGKIDSMILWETLTQDIPELYHYCQKILENLETEA